MKNTGWLRLARLHSQGLMDAQRRLRELAVNPAGEVRHSLAEETHTNENLEAGKILLAWPPTRIRRSGSRSQMWAGVIVMAIVLVYVLVGGPMRIP